MKEKDYDAIAREIYRDEAISRMLYYDQQEDQCVELIAAILRKHDEANEDESCIEGYICPECGAVTDSEGQSAHRSTCSILIAAQRHDEAEAGGEPGEGYWWCPECREAVDGHEVTFQEYHERCGTKVIAKTARPAPRDDTARNPDGTPYKGISSGAAMCGAPKEQA